MSGDPLIDSIIRSERRARALPQGARCVKCGETDRKKLVMSRRPVRCYKCNARMQGRLGVDAHHVGRKPSPLEWPVDPSTHEVLIELQRLWVAAVRPGSLLAILADLALLVALTPSHRLAAAHGPKA